MALAFILVPLAFEVLVNDGFFLLQNAEPLGHQDFHSFFLFSGLFRYPFISEIEGGMTREESPLNFDDYVSRQLWVHIGYQLVR